MVEAGETIQCIKHVLLIQYPHKGRIRVRVGTGPPRITWEAVTGWNQNRWVS